MRHFGPHIDFITVIEIIAQLNIIFGEQLSIFDIIEFFIGIV